MGLGLGGLALRLLGSRGRGAWLGPALVLSAAAAMLGPRVVLSMGLDFGTVFGSAAMAARFSAAVLLLGSTFFFAGLGLSMIFRDDPQRIARLYMSDLAGAGVGAGLAVVAMNVLGTPSAVVWAALPVLVASLLASRRWWRLAPVVLAVVFAVLVPRANDVLRAQRPERAPVIYTHWDAMAKLKVYDFGGHYRGINIDNVANTPVFGFDGDWDTIRADTAETHWDIDVGNLIRRFESCRFLSLGAGGGSDVFQALEYKAGEIHAVEVNGHINRMMTRGDPGGYLTGDSTVADSAFVAPDGHVITMDEFSGHIYDDPTVRVVTEDARTYVRRHKNAFDVIYSLSSNTWAALGSGSFALAENYLFTVEAFQDYWEALSERGFLSMEHQVYMPRLVSEVILALEREGVENPRDHFAVYALPKLRRQLLLLSKQPLTDEIRNHAYGRLTPEKFDAIHLVYPAPDSLADNLVNRVVLDGWRAMADSSAIALAPCTDDRPFIAQMGLWKNLDLEKLAKMPRYAEFQGFPVSRIVLLVILLVVLVLVVPLNLVPYAVGGAPKLRAVPWLYFFAIGAAFMAVEVALIQRYTLFIGASMYSIAAVLVTLLVAGGIGSRFSGRFAGATAFLGIVVWLLLEVLVLRGATARLSGLEVVPRVFVTMALVFPLGFFMGMPFPRGVERVGDRVDWGFAVNGAASVLGATGALMTALAFGFDAVLLGAAALYLIAFLLLRARRAW